MARLLAVSVLALAVAAACAPITPVATPAASPDTATVAPAQSEDARLHAWFERMYEEDLQRSPIQMTFQGRKDRYGELDDYSREATRERVAWLQAKVREMAAAFDYELLGAES